MEKDVFQMENDMFQIEKDVFQIRKEGLFPDRMLKKRWRWEECYSRAGIIDDKKRNGDNMIMMKLARINII